jgi:hypothetical protein
MSIRFVIQRRMAQNILLGRHIDLLEVNTASWQDWLAIRTHFYLY